MFCRLILVSFMLVWFAGCKGMPINLGLSEQPQLPAWYTQTPADENAFYAVGEGLSFKEAEKSARASLAEQIQVQVSSYVKTLQVRDGSYNRDYFKAETESRTTDIALTNATQVQKEMLGVNCYSMIKLDKSALVTQQSAVIDADKTELVHVLNQPLQPSFERWWQLKRVAPVASRLQNNAVLMAVVAGQEDAIANQLVLNFNTALRDTEGYRTLSLVNRTQIDGLDSLVRKQLSDQGIDVKNEAGSDVAALVMATAFKQQVIGSDLYMDGEMMIELVSASGAILNQHKMNKSAVVIGDQSLGIRQINRQLYQTLKSEKILDKLINES